MWQSSLLALVLVRLHAPGLGADRREVGDLVGDVQDAEGALAFYSGSRDESRVAVDFHPLTEDPKARGESNSGGGVGSLFLGPRFVAGRPKAFRGKGVF